MVIAFTIRALPVAQPRQRHRIISAGGRIFAHNYTPTKHPVNAFKASAQMACRQAYQGPPLEGPISITVTFVMPRPKALYWKTKPMPRTHHIVKPDFDNLAKSLVDGLSQTLWMDDTQLCDVRIVKVVAAGDEQPHVLVELQSLNCNPDKEE